MLRLSAFVCLLALASRGAAQDMPLSQILIDGEGWQVRSKDHKSIRGLAADAQGNVYIADPESKKIDRLGTDGRVTLFAQTEKGIRGLCFGPDGRLFGCQPGKRRIVALDEKGKETVVVERCAARDLVVTAAGTIYYAPGGLPVSINMEPHPIAVVGSDGKPRNAGQLPMPEGLTLWPDQGTLVVGSSGDKHLWAFRVERDGSLAHKERYYTLRVRPGKESGPTALTVDSAGRLYAATAEGVQIFDPTGRLSGVLLRPAPEPISAVTFGGAERDTLFVGCGDKVFARKTRAKGVFPFKSKP